MVLCIILYCYRSVARQLLKGESVVAELYDSVSIFFSDLVGFAQLCLQSTPIQIINLLNEFYSVTDEVIAGHDVYKVSS